MERLCKLNLELNIWYLNAGSLVATVGAIKAALMVLKEHLPHRGLEVNLLKCKLFRPGASCADHAFEGIPRFSLDEGTVVLEVSIGSNAFVAMYVDDVCAKLAHLAKRIGLLKSNVAKFLLLRACFGACRINHLLHSLPFGHGRSLAEKASSTVRGNPGCVHRNPSLVFGPTFSASNLAFGSAHEELPRRFWRLEGHSTRAQSECSVTGKP